ncbi:cellulose synthase catalytic subunit [Klebsiella pneumoniae]|uniref:Cellulose synthase catalytic subunit n=1 Tax=Klebsiella pneumoniae TaxID=573 RepID=A0A378A0D9_KLEPN|nr:cellulose synthase catalytic subunit [Klebsiella pneumoniae]
MPEPEKKVNWRSLAALEGVHGRYTQWLEKLPEQMNARTGHLDKQKELAHLNPKTAPGDPWGGDLLLAGAGADVYYAAL